MLLFPANLSPGRFRRAERRTQQIQKRKANFAQKPPVRQHFHPGHAGDGPAVFQGSREEAGAGKQEVPGADDGAAAGSGQLEPADMPPQQKQLQAAADDRPRAHELLQDRQPKEPQTKASQKRSERPSGERNHRQNEREERRAGPAERPGSFRAHQEARQPAEQPVQAVRTGPAEHRLQAQGQVSSETRRTKQRKCNEQIKQAD